MTPQDAPAGPVLGEEVRRRVVAELVLYAIPAVRRREAELGMCALVAALLDAARAEERESMEAVVRAVHYPYQDYGMGPNCAGCATHATFTPYEKCKTIAALDAARGGAS